MLNKGNIYILPGRGARLGLLLAQVGLVVVVVGQAQVEMKVVRKWDYY